MDNIQLQTTAQESVKGNVSLSPKAKIKKRLNTSEAPNLEGYECKRWYKDEGKKLGAKLFSALRRSFEKLFEE